MMHIVKSDTWTLGVSWLDKRIYSEGGLEIHIGKRILCFWKRPKAFCPYCLNEGEHWPLSHEVWTCPSCGEEYNEG